MEPFIVKEASEFHFKKNYAIDEDQSSNGRMVRSNYDDMFIKLSAGIVPGQVVIFEQSDRGQKSGRPLVTTTNYIAEAHDSICVRLVRQQSETVLA